MPMWHTGSWGRVRITTENMGGSGRGGEWEEVEGEGGGSVGGRSWETKGGGSVGAKFKATMQ